MGFWASSDGGTEFESYKNAMKKFRSRIVGGIVKGVPFSESSNMLDITIEDVIAYARRNERQAIREGAARQCLSMMKQ
jgi:hypothetical protein